MFEKDALHKRGQALEDEYFRRVDQKLERKLREKTRRETSAKELSVVTGLTDETLLEHLIDVGIDSTKIAAFALVPVVWVAWADGTITPDERQAVIHASLGRKIRPDSAAAELVHHWLQNHPPLELWEVWKEYAIAMKASLSPAIADLVARAIVGQALSVARVAGNRFGTRAVNRVEQQVIEDIKAVLGLTTWSD